MKVFKLAPDLMYNFGLGHCQVTYVTKNDLGQKIYYCLQYQGENWTPKVRLMQCTPEGEPSHEVKIESGTKISFDLPEGDTKTILAVREWIKQYENQGVET